MAPPPEYTEALKTGYCRGIYTLWVSKRKLLTSQSFEGNTFKLGGFKWRVAITRCPSRQQPREALKVILVSQNDVKIRSHVSYSISSDQGMLAEQSTRELRIACPFHMIEEVEIPVDRLMTVTEESLIEGDIVVLFDLKNIRAAYDDDEPGPMVNTRPVKLEILDRQSIERWLWGSKFGVVSLARNHSTEVCGCTLVRPWAQSNPDRRYWLCERTDTGDINIKKCLNNTSVLDSFTGSCEQYNGKDLWVTVFMEKKESETNFQPVDDDTILVFCKLWEGPRSDPTYLGHLLVKNTAQCSYLSEQIMDMDPVVRDRGNCGVYLEERESQLKEITCSSLALEKCGVGSGSVLILRTWPLDDEAQSDADVTRIFFSFEAPAPMDHDISNEWRSASSVRFFSSNVTSVDLDLLPIFDSFPLPSEPVLSDNEEQETDDMDH